MSRSGRTVLVTGANRGIGRELTRQFVDLGAHVVAAGRDHDGVHTLAQAHPGRVAPWTVDLSDPAAVDAFLAALVERHPDLSIVVNNAAVQTLTDFTTDDPQVLRPVLHREVVLNFDTVIAISVGLLPLLRRQPQAAIANITTGLALVPKRSAPVYCATKAGVRAFTRALRYQCDDARLPVRVTEVVMTLVDTDMTLGRGTGKIAPAAAAAAVIAGVRRGAAEVYVGKTKILPILMRISPALAYRALRNS